MRIFLLTAFFILILSSCSKNREVEGTWYWTFTNQHGEKHEVEVVFEAEEEDKIKGNYCSNYGDNKYSDCDDNTQNFYLVRKNQNELLGQFISNNASENDAVGEIEITYLPFNQSLLFNIIREPSAKFYFPDEVEFTRR